MTNQEEIREKYTQFLMMDKKLSRSDAEWKAYKQLCFLAGLNVVLKVERGLPETLTNNIGCMSKVEIEDFACKVLSECDYPHRIGWTTAGNILIGDVIYIDESLIDAYPYLAKYWVLHEVAHIDTHHQDDRHGEVFHSRLAELINRFIGGYSATEPLI